MLEEVAHGQLGYSEWAIAVIDLGHCSCPGCGGHLVDRTCASCGCMHWVCEPTAHVRARYATTIPNHDGRCAPTSARLAAETREREQERLRAVGK